MPGCQTPLHGTEERINLRTVKRNGDKDQVKVGHQNKNPFVSFQHKNCIIVYLSYGMQVGAYFDWDELCL